MLKKCNLVLISLLTCAGMLFLLTGCTDETEKTGNENEQKSSEEFAWLNSAYENRWLTKDELKSIAFYYNGLHYEGEVDYGKDFSPLEKNPVALDELTKEKIISLYCKKFEMEEFRDEVKITSYYGTYGNCTVIDIASGCTTGGGDPLFYPEYELDGVSFYNYSFIGVYKNNI